MSSIADKIKGYVKPVPGDKHNNWYHGADKDTIDAELPSAKARDIYHTTDKPRVSGDFGERPKRSVDLGDRPRRSGDYSAVRRSGEMPRRSGDHSRGHHRSGSELEKELIKNGHMPGIERAGPERRGPGEEDEGGNKTRHSGFLQHMLHGEHGGTNVSRASNQ